MPRVRTLLAVSALLALAAGPAAAVAPAPGAGGERAEQQVRFMTYNASLTRSSEGQLVADLATGDDRQAQQVAELVQRIDPDVLLINEFDYDEEERAVRLFADNYLAVSQGGAAPVAYPYRYVAPVNTGVPSGHDLDNDGTVGGPGDALGFGFFPGQFGMVVYSKYPIDTAQVRTFQQFRWQDMPGAMLPDDPATPAPADWYTPAELADLPLSSKSHWDVPVRVGPRTVHVLASHPTPPVFDGPEDRNGTRNHDEIRFWADYVSGGERASYIADDQGRTGGLAGGSFVIAGDQNADPYDGDSVPGAVQQLLDHPRVNDTHTPSSEGAVEAAATQPGNESHRTPARFDTADFGEPPGNLRVDYVLPSQSLRITGSGVFWPRSDQPHADLLAASDHRPVWVDVRVPPARRTGR